MFEVIARLTVRDGELDGFKRQAAEIMRQTREKDTKTLRYDWFLTDDGTACEVLEGYTDADGLLEHHHHIEEAKAMLFHEFAGGHDMTFYGQPSPALAAAMEVMADHVTFHRYSFFQGLDTRGFAPHFGPFEATARLKIRPGELEGFERQVAEIVRQTRELDVTPLRYDWFLGDDGATCDVREAYLDADALLAQQHRIGEAKLGLFRDFVAGHTMTFYGEVSPPLSSALEAMGTDFTHCSLFQSLDVDVTARDEVPV
jgi:quinol monooxygenase YgiN